MKHQVSSDKISKLTWIGLLITVGIVYGDIGTSPLYVFRAILNGAHVVNTDLVLGSISCIFWTLTLQTTFKYIIVTLRADNQGEGGILALFALIRRRFPWVYVFALIGGATLLADGIITPSITVTSAVEGLKMFSANIPVVPIVLIIITLLFIIQQFGTNLLGESFGPIMGGWFLMLAIFGIVGLVQAPIVLKALSPYYAIKLLVTYPGGFVLLGAVFLCTTGAEALYSDLGHCGIKNIRISWIFVKTALVLNYLGQGGWILTHPDSLTSEVNPFFSMMPPWFRVFGVIIATAAAIIASQALISGSYTLVSEAIRLNFWPRVKINHPTNVKGQMYIPSTNWQLWLAVMLVVLLFQKSANMEAAYGLSITITMLMTTILLLFYLRFKKVPLYIIISFAILYMGIECSFLIANFFKFFHGGWVTLMMAGVILVVMYIWHAGRRMKNKFFVFENLDKYMDTLRAISKDQSIPKYSTNLVYLTRTFRPGEIESKILYSIIYKKPKRADIYWFIHVDHSDAPYTMDYKVTTLDPGTMYRIDFILGFRVEPRINLYFRQVVSDLVANGEVDIESRYDSLKGRNIRGEFRFVVIDQIQTYDFDFKPSQQFIMDCYSFLRAVGISDVREFGLDTSNVTVEKVPLRGTIEPFLELKRLE
jgi:KUP system potassium uptake protein